MSEEKKNVGKGIAAGGGVVLIAGAVLAFLSGKVPGLGPGESLFSASQPIAESSISQSAETESSAQTTQSTEESTEESKPETTTAGNTVEITYIDVTVSGNGYNYENKSYADTELQSLTDTLSAAVKDENTIIRITDQNASLNAYNALTDALTAAKLRYADADK